jgi:pimeloyl-ACP methyl ester carboxylesterase
MMKNIAVNRTGGTVLKHSRIAAHADTSAAVEVSEPAEAIVVICTKGFDYMSSERSSPKLDPREEHFEIPGPRDGLRLFLRRLAGSRRDPRRAVLYVHGATFPSASSIAHRFSGRSWRDALCAAGFDVWGFDFYGFGCSARYAEMSQAPDQNPPLCNSADAAEQLHVVVRFVVAHMGLDRLSIISHSWGSMPVGRFAGSHPTLLDRWVLFAPIAKRAPRRYEKPPTLPAWRLVSLEDQFARFTEDVPAHEPPVLAQPEFDVWGEAYLDSDPESRSRTPPSVKIPLGPFSDLIQAWHGQLPYEPSAVSCPIALIRGEWDGLIPDEDARWVFDAFSRSPDKRDIKISRGTHLMHLEVMREALWRESIGFLLADDVPSSTSQLGADRCSQ